MVFVSGSANYRAAWFVPYGNGRLQSPRSQARVALLRWATELSLVDGPVRQSYGLDTD